jgi:hypothetical protein
MDSVRICRDQGTTTGREVKLASEAGVEVP